jgi:heme-degrading monooxygenase HmoA
MSLLTTNRVRHAVVFTLAHPDGTPEEADFLAALADLARIPGVEEFEVLREVSPKNDYTHAVSMEFADRAAYETYNEHPQHVAFVRDRWDAEVTSFLEIDTVVRD